MPGEVNCIFTKALIPFVEHEVGAPGVDAILRTTGLTREYLTADHNWIPLALADALVRLGMALMHEPDEERWARRYGDAFMDWKPSRGERSYIGTYSMAIGDPRGVYERVPVMYRALMRHARLDVEALGRRQARFRVTPVPGQPMPRWACVWHQVILERFPTNWGLPRAVVTESQCAAKGADACVLDVVWKNPSLGARFWGAAAAGGAVSAALGSTLVSGAAFPGASWIASALPVVAGVAVGLALRERDRRRHTRRLLDLQSEEIIFSNDQLEQKFRDLDEFARGLEDKVRERTEELEDSNRGLTQALARQTATADILRIISRSPGDAQPVFEAILDNARSLCESETGILFRFDGEAFHALARRIPDPVFDALFAAPRRPGPAAGLGRVAGEKRAVHIEDVRTGTGYLTGDTIARQTVELGGARTWLGVPLLKDGQVTGAIVIYRKEVRPFSDAQIDLLKTFADQAVIAIENVRLFTELQDKNRAVTEALEQQTATAEILRTISRSPTDVQPVFEAIVENAARLCEGFLCIGYRYDGELIRVVATSNFSPEARAALDREYPCRLDAETVTAQTIRERRTIHVDDVTGPDVPEGSRRIGRGVAYRTLLSVPMLRDGEPVGSISVGRIEQRPFSAEQIRMVKTFADQAVIAIENVRLFTALQTAYRDLQATQVQLVQREKMASVGQLVAGVAHELNNPIGFVSSNVVTLEDFIARIRALLQTYDAAALPEAERARIGERRAELKVDYALRYLDSMVQGIREGADRARKIVRDLRIFARTEDDVWQPVDLHEDIESSLTLLNHVMKEQVTVHRKFGSVPPVDCVRSQIDQVFLNLLANAAQAIDGPGEITIETKEEAGLAVVRITDSGPGIPADVIGRVFDPFFTTKIVGEGTGLGLSISYEIIKKHRGEITAESPAGSGATFTVRIPIARRM